MIKAWPLSWLYHFAAGTMLREGWQTNVKRKMPLLTEVEIKADFDMCGSTYLLCVFFFLSSCVVQNYQRSFMSFSFCIWTFELDCCYIVCCFLPSFFLPWSKACWVFSHSVVWTCCFGFVRLKGCRYLLQCHCALQQATEPPLLPSQAITNTHTDTHTCTHSRTRHQALGSYPECTTCQDHRSSRRTNMHRPIYCFLHLHMYTQTHLGAMQSRLWMIGLFYSQQNQKKKHSVIPLYLTQPRAANSS